MKLLVLSDSHGNWRVLQKLAELEQPDAAIHLGDLLGDAQKLSLACPGLPVEAVAGNCDGLFARGDTARVLVYEGVRFFLTHGHTYHVKSHLDLLAEAGRQAQADAILFGHTHRKMLERGPGGIWLVNPGTAGGVYAAASYAVAWAESGTVRFELKDVPQA